MLGSAHDTYVLFNVPDSPAHCLEAVQLPDIGENLSMHAVALCFLLGSMLSRTDEASRARIVTSCFLKCLPGSFNSKFN